MKSWTRSNAASVVFRLAIISIIVGIALHALGLNPLTLVENLRGLVRTISESGLDILEWLGTRLLIGALVVVPIWLVVLLVKLVFGRSSSRE